MDEPYLSYRLKAGFAVYQPFKPCVVLKVISALADLFSDILPLPAVPVGNMGKNILAVFTLELAELVHLPARAAVVAPEPRALAVHLKLCSADRTLIKYLVYILCALGRGYAYSVVPLPGVFVVYERLLYPALYLCGGELFYLLAGHYLYEIRLYRHLYIRMLSPLGRAQEVAAVDIYNDRHLRLFRELSERAVYLLVYSRK